MGDDTPSEEEFRFQTVGEQLKAERERQGLSLADIAGRTRVPLRHLESIENSDFSNLPGTTYTLGFTRSFARSLGLDATKVGSDLRAELASSGHESYHLPAQNYEPADPSRVPSKAFAWTAAAIAVALLAAYLIWRNMALDSSVAPSTVANSEPAPATAAVTPQAPVAAADPNGDVVLTATDTVWIKITDADKKRVFESEMKAGDKFTVPKDAKDPKIVTGRPQALNVTIGGKPVPPLGPPEKTVANLGVSAAALLARITDTSLPAATNQAAPLQPAPATR